MFTLAWVFIYRPVSSAHVRIIHAGGDVVRINTSSCDIICRVHIVAPSTGTQEEDNFQYRK